MVIGLLVVPQWWLLWCVVGALAQGSGISLAFTLAVLRARDAEAVRGLSGMSQLIGDGLGASSSEGRHTVRPVGRGTATRRVRSG
jgi:CP family cyanate transporter-like MFS transporter